MNKDFKILMLSSASALVAVAAGVAAPAAAQDRNINFHIQAEPMDAALNDLSAQSGMRVLYPYDQVVGLRAPALSGRMPARTGLEKLIERTPLRISLAENGVMALTGPSTQSLIKVSTAAIEQTAVEPAVSAPPPPLTSEVVVTGVRGQARSAVDSPTPVDVIGAADIQRGGQAGNLAALETLVPSFNLPFRSGGGISSAISTGGLDGLNPDQSLVLVNGKRRHKTSLLNSVSSIYNGSLPVDLDLIPTSSIGHIEILRDGAAAQYGSDAIAGVINIILKDTPGGQLSASTGQNFDRSDGSVTLMNGSYGLRLGDGGFIDFFASGKAQGLSNRAIPVASTVQLYPLVNGQPDPREATANRLVTRNYGQLPQSGINVGYNAEYKTDSIDYYSFSTYSFRNSLLPFFYHSPNNVYTLPQIYPNGFRPQLRILENDFQIAGGARGQFIGWSWDLSSTYGANYGRENVSQTLNASLGPSSPTAFHVGDLVSSEWVNALDVTRDFKLKTLGDLQVSFGAQHRRETYQIKAGDPAGYAAGGYIIPAGQPFAWQAAPPETQSTPSFQPSDASSSARNNYAIYGELGYTPIKKLFIGGAVRYEDYDDSAGSKLIGKGDARYSLTDWLAVRGSVSTGFRAPALAQEKWSATASQLQLVGGVTQLLQIKTLPVDSAAAIALGATPLKPETSTNYSAGITFNPITRLTMTLDAYQIEVDNRIALTSTLTGTAVSNILISKGLSGLLSAQYYTNALNTKTQGLDFVGTYRQDLAQFGVLKFNLGYNHNTTQIIHVNPNPPQLSSLGANYVLFDRLSRSYLTTALPQDKIVLGVNWIWNKFNVNLRATRYGGYTIQQDLPSQDRSFDAAILTDLEVSYNLPKNVTLSLGADNIGNVYPSANGIFTAILGSGQYPLTSPFGITGGFYYTRLQWNF
jgi:iron complex outermembrane receptor protein